MQNLRIFTEQLKPHLLFIAMRSVFIVFLLVCASSLSAQSLSVFGIDATNFPTMKAKFYAFDAAGNQQNPSTSALTATENGIARTVTSVTCDQNLEPLALSSVLVIDVSGSMSGKNIGLAKAAATSWINTIQLDNSECAVTSFDNNNYLNQDFTKNRSKLLSAVNALRAQGGTDYDAGLYEPIAGGLQVSKTGKNQKVIIFLTDGLDNTSQTSTIIAEAKNQNCPIFSVVIGLPCPQCLKDISDQTGGTWFEQVVSDSQIIQIYRSILSQVQSLTPCELTWQSAETCKKIDSVNVTFTWNTLSTNGVYSIPQKGLSKLVFDPPTIFFLSPPIGAPSTKTVTVTASNGGFTVTNISSTNPSYDISPKSFSLSTGQSLPLTVSYTPTDKNYSWTTFTFSTESCPYTYFANGGYPGILPSVSTLKVISPNGGERYIAGSDTVVTWTGIPLTDSVDLQYSLDNGAHWNIITDNAKGGEYKWNLPKTQSDKCLVKAQQLSPTIVKGWAKLASTGEQGYGISVDSFGNIFVTGLFSGTINFSGISLTSAGKDDLFVAKYHPDKTIEWVRRGGGKGNDYARGAVTDLSGNIYICGYFEDTADFEGTQVISKGGPECYIAKYHPDGSLEWVRRSGGEGIDNAKNLAADQKGNIYAAGYFDDSADFSGNILVSKGQNTFLAKYHPDGTMEWVINGTRSYSQDICVNTVGEICIIGEYFSSANFSGTILKGSGMFVAKYRSDGSIMWARQVSDTYEEGHITTDKTGNIYLAGGFDYGKHDLMGDTLTNDSGLDIFIVKLNADGKKEWIRPGSLFSGGGYAHKIILDAAGNIYVCGKFYGEIRFDSILLKTNGGYDGFVVKYKPNGTPEWSKQVEGESTGICYSMTTDEARNIYVTGHIYGLSSIEETTLNPAYNGVYIWKISNGVLQSDISDSVFSIVMPQIASQDIDMGKVFVASAKDSVIQAFVRNTGTYPFRVDSINIVGADASEFSLVSGIPPFTVLAGSVQLVEFRFKPSSAGVKSAQTMVITQADTLFQNITGEGVLPTISVVGNLIDFGQIIIGNFKDTTISVAITNTGALSVSFTNSSQLGPDTKQFSIQSGGGAFTLNPSETRSVTLRFAPKYIGRTSGRIGFDYNGPGSPAVLNLYGQGLGGLVRILDDSAYAGERRDVPMVLEGVPVNSVQSVATNFRARVLYDKTILYPVDKNIQSGKRYDTVTISGSLGSDDVIARVPFLAMLGMNDVSPMSIVDFEWLDASGNPADFDVETENGMFKVLGICDQGGKRLFNPDGQVLMSSIVPNPTSNMAHIEITTIEKGHTELVVTNLLGQTIATLFDGEFEPGVHDFQLSTSDLTTGSYFLTLRTPTVRKIQRLDIAK